MRLMKGGLRLAFLFYVLASVIMDTKITPLNRAAGFKMVAVFVEADVDKARDESQESVRVNAIKVKECEAYARTIEDECLRAEFVCGKPAGWADTLTRESVEAIIEADAEINLDFFSRWLRRKAELAERIQPGSTAKFFKAPESPSPTGSLKSA